MKETSPNWRAVASGTWGMLEESVDVAELDAFGGSPFDSTDGEVESLGFRYCGYSMELFSDRALYVKR